MSSIHLGIAGWSLPRIHWDLFPAQGTHLARYARVFSAVEINSSFYRDHRDSTYARWADSVPETFRFSVKVSRRLTHEQGLGAPAPDIAAAISPILSLGSRLGALLVQLPPSLAFPAETARGFFERLRELTNAPVACEPRHPSWLTDESRELFARFRIAKVTADPAPCPDPDQRFAGTADFSYFRLHGRPRVYYSAYETALLSKLARHLRSRSAPGEENRDWVIFDNTALFHAIPNALQLREILQSLPEAA